MNLSSNSITAEGVGKVGSLIGISCQQLKSLNLSGNPIGDQGIGNLVEKMLFAEQLEVLDLSNTSITHIGAQRLMNYLDCFPKLRTVIFDGNQIGAETGRIIEERMQEQRERIVENEQGATVIDKGGCSVC